MVLLHSNQGNAQQQIVRYHESFLVKAMVSSGVLLYDIGTGRKPCQVTLSLNMFEPWVVPSASWLARMNTSNWILELNMLLLYWTRMTPELKHGASLTSWHKHGAKKGRLRKHMPRWPEVIDPRWRRRWDFRSRWDFKNGTKKGSSLWWYSQQNGGLMGFTLW